MPVGTVLSYVQGLLSGLPMPGQGTASLVCSIVPPPVFSEPGIIPTCYLWAGEGRESRSTALGSPPRNTGPGTPAGFKAVVHQVQWVLLWSGTDEPAHLLFASMIDTILERLRTATPMPADAADPATGTETQLVDVGEDMTYRTAIRPAADQRSNQYEALFSMPVTEVIRA